MSRGVERKLTSLNKKSCYIEKHAHGQCLAIYCDKLIVAERIETLHLQNLPILPVLFNQHLIMEL